MYSFGIVLLEIITGQPPVSSDSRDGPMLSRVKSRLEKGDIDSIVDKRLKGDYDSNTMWKVLEIAMTCASPTSIHRPPVSQVVAQLKECSESKASWEQSKRTGSQMSSPYDSIVD